MEAIDLRYYISQVGCDKHDAPARCFECGRAMRRYHVHVFVGGSERVTCPRCADGKGAC